MGRRRQLIAVLVVGLAACTTDGLAKSGRGASAPTTINTYRSTLMTLTTRLGCQQLTTARSYEAGGVPEISRGKDCWVDGHVVRLHVFASAEDRVSFVREQADWASQHPEIGRPDRPTIGGIWPVVSADNWAIFADSDTAADYVSARLGGETVLAATPFSYLWPQPAPPTSAAHR